MLPRNCIKHHSPALAVQCQIFPPLVSTWLMYTYSVRIQLLRCIRFRTGSTYHADRPAPLADLVGVERQVAVLAFQLVMHLQNFIVPTSAVC